MIVEYLNNDKRNFIKLTQNKFVEYSFIYRINDTYKIKDLLSFHSKFQLLFQKIEDTNQQINLTYVDSVFVNILADLTLEVFLNKINSFSKYIETPYKIKLVSEKDEKQYFKYKFFSFIHLLLYYDLASQNFDINKGFFDRVFYSKNNLNEIEYFTIYDQYILQKQMLDEIKLEIDYSSSSITNHYVKLVLMISY